MTLPRPVSIGLEVTASFIGEFGLTVAQPGHNADRNNRCMTFYCELVSLYIRYRISRYR